MVVLGAIVTTVSLQDYLSQQIFAFLWRNSGLFFGQRNFLPGVFETLPMGGGTNASLWTLPIEGRFYLYLAAGFFILRYMPLLAATLCGVALVYALWSGADASVTKPAERLGILFATGICLAAVERLRGLGVAAFVIATAAALLALRGQSYAAWQIAFALASVMIGLIPVRAAFSPRLTSRMAFICLHIRCSNSLRYGVYPSIPRL